MATMALLEDPEEIKVAASNLARLAEMFDDLRVQLKTHIEEELNTACKGDVADEFSKFYSENIDTKLIAEKVSLDTVVAALNTTAGIMESTETAVKSAF